MNKFIDTTNAQYHTANDETVSAQELIDACRTSAEVFFFRNRKSLPTLDLDDLFQEVIGRAIRSIAGFDSRKSSLKTWVSWIARNYVLDFIDSEKRRTAVFGSLTRTNKDGDEVIIPQALEYRSDEFEADYDLHTAEDLEEIEEAISGLSENRRRVVELTREGFKPREITKITGWSSNKVYGLLCKGRKDLVERLGRHNLQEYGIAA